MKKIIPSMILIMSAMMFLLISCKKDQQSTIRPATQPSSGDQPSSGGWKIDTVFQYTAGSYFPSIHVIQARKDFYIPILDSVSDSGLKVFRALNSTSFEEVRPYSIQVKGPCYVRGKGKITYAELITGYSSVVIHVKILGKW